MLGTLTIDSSVYQVALYIRLSREDIKSAKELESESITNQRDLLMRFVRENNLKLYDCYVDDGYTGTNFNRPGFQRLIQDIEAGKVNMVITKDLSRLGRDYIGVGEYLEKYFPTHNVRYIALTDNIDTYTEQSNLDMAPFKAVFNDMYAKDISKKIIASLRTKQKEGKWVGGCAPLGYMKDPNDKNHLIINEDEAWIVRKIFDLALSGLSTFKIKTELEREKIPTCTNLRSDNRTSHSSDAKMNLWSLKTIKGILTNELYTGDLVQNRRRKINYKIKKTISNKKEDWIIVKGTHERIVTREEFDIVNKTIIKNYQPNTKKQVRLLDGLLVCYECKHRIGVCSPRSDNGKTYIVCNYYRRNSKSGLCTSHGFNYDKLENEVLRKVKEVCFSTLDKNRLNEEQKKLNLSKLKNKYFKLKEKLESDIDNIKIKLDKMYIDKLEEKITEDMYDRIREKYMKEMSTITKELEDVNEYLGSKEEIDYSAYCEKAIDEFINMKNIDRSVLLKLIDRIEVHNDKQLDIYFNFKEMNM